MNHERYSSMHVINCIILNHTDWKCLITSLGQVHSWQQSILAQMEPTVPIYFFQEFYFRVVSFSYQVFNLCKTEGIGFMPINGPESSISFHLVDSSLFAQFPYNNPLVWDGFYYCCRVIATQEMTILGVPHSKSKMKNYYMFLFAIPPAFRNAVYTKISWVFGGVCNLERRL